MRLSSQSHIADQRGASLMEFALCLPILLFISGATIDLARYMRYLQITSFISQEVGGQIYRYCSDITVYSKPIRNTQKLDVDEAETLRSIALCMQRYQSMGQAALNQSLGRAVISSTVMRTNLNEVVQSATCAVTTVSAIGSSSSQTPVANLIISGNTFNISLDLTQSEIDNIATSPIISSDQNQTAGSNLSTSMNQPLINNSASNGVYTSSGRQLLSQQQLCDRRKLAAAEIAYAFQPVVKFLPSIMTKFDTNGIYRETAIY